MVQTVALFGLGGQAKADSKYPIIADEEVMKPKAHGTSEKPVMKNLKWGCDFEVFIVLMAWRFCVPCGFG